MIQSKISVEEIDKLSQKCKDLVEKYSQNKISTQKVLDSIRSIRCGREVWEAVEAVCENEKYIDKIISYLEFLTEYFDESAAIWREYSQKSSVGELEDIWED